MTSARGRVMKRGLTLVELLLALAITSMIGLAMSTMIVSVARGMSSMSSGRSATQRAHVLHSRLRAYTDAGLCVLDSEEDRGFVLWLFDSNSDGGVNLTEFRVFWFDPDTRTMSVEWVSFPEDWTEEEVTAADIKVAVSEDMFALMDAQRGFGYTQSAQLADAIGDLDLEFTGADPTLESRFSLRGVADADGDSAQEVLFRLVLVGHTLPDGVVDDDAGDDGSGGGGGGGGGLGGLLGGLLGGGG